MDKDLHSSVLPTSYLSAPSPETSDSTPSAPNPSHSCPQRFNSSEVWLLGFSIHQYTETSKLQLQRPNPTNTTTKLPNPEPGLQPCVVDHVRRLRGARRPWAEVALPRAGVGMVPWSPV